MDPRRIAKELSEWYQLELDPFQTHSQNVRNLLHGPVLNLTSRVLLQDSEEQGTDRSLNDIEEEKKLCSIPRDGSEDTNDRTGKFPVEKIISEAPLKQSQQEDEIYFGLRRRSRARLDAFLKGVEISVTSVTSERSPPPSPSLHSRSKKSASSLGVPKAPSSKRGVPKAPPAAASNPQSPSRTAKAPRKPHIESSPVLTSLNNHGKALLRSVSVEASSVRKHAQIRDMDLRTRLELYIRSCCRVRSLKQDCVVAYEPDKAIKARAQLIVTSFISTVGCVRRSSPVLLQVILTATKELLAVEFIGEDLFVVISRMVKDYEKGSSFDSLQFLSTPAETRLSPMILKYMRYLQSDWKAHERGCILERMLSQSLDVEMRKFFKHAEFVSIGHLLEACQLWRGTLNLIELPPTSGVGELDLCNNPEAVQQATRDLQREVITINGQTLCWGSRRELVHLLSQSLNSRSLTAGPAKKKKNPIAVGKSESCPSLVHAVSNASSSEEGARNKNRRASFHLSAVDLLTRRLLIAASRTGTGGDAYFIVRDLFGGEEVDVVPAKVLPHHVRASRLGSTDIEVRFASVTIRCHSSFDIYPSGRCDCEPLIQLHTTTSEIIHLRELRSCDSATSSELRCLEDDGSRSSNETENLVLQEQPNQTGRRILSIRPALYEKVQDWNTPS